MKSEIRDSQINALLDKVKRQDYGKYLLGLTLNGVRGFGEATVRFDFPVTAVIGTNGGGKTTVLGAAGTIYSGIRPRRFFSKSGKYDSTMKGWTVEYDVVDREVKQNGVVRRTASFKDQRWRRDTLARDVLVFGVSRTVPANERKELQKCATAKFSASRVEELSDEVADAVEKILGKSVAGFRRLRVGRGGDVTLLAGTTDAGESYSEFHFGAGEASVIRMVREIEQAPNQSLILIEEIENGLHPVATVRMVEYLMEVAERKRVQTVFTTHSDDALRPLPSEAIWSATRDRVTQGKLSVEALRAVVGEIDAQLAIFVEDAFAAEWLRACIAKEGSVIPDQIEIYPVQGDGTAVTMNRYHNSNPATKTPSICIIDGDSEQEADDDNHVYRLPGQMPERTVVDDVLERWETTGGLLTVRLTKSFDRTEWVHGRVRDTWRTNRDPHVFFQQVGEAIGFVPEATVVSAFTTTWAEVMTDESQAIAQLVSEAFSE